MRDFSVKQDDGPRWKTEHTHMLLLVIGAVIFAVLVYLFVLSAVPASTSAAAETFVSDDDTAQPTSEAAAATEAPADEGAPTNE